MNSEVRWDPAPWRRALEAADADGIYTGFSKIVEHFATRMHRHDPSVLNNIDALYQTTMEAHPSVESSIVTQTAVQTALDMVKGLHLAIHGYFDYEKVSPPRQLSYEYEFGQINNLFSRGDKSAAEETFKKISSFILHKQFQVDSFADLSLKPNAIHQQVRNWASALGMLARSHR